MTVTKNTTSTMMMMMLIKSFSANLLIMVFCSILFRGIPMECVHINKISPSQSIESGSSQSVILDCQFEIDEVHDEKLVLKWYQKGDNHPIYQWIKSKDSRKFSDKIEPFVDKNYSVDDKLTRFRAIRLINPAFSLSGEYECVVSSLHNQVSDTTKLIIYVASKTFEMNVSEVDNGQNITCSATGLYPEPEMSLFRIRPTNESYNNPIEITDKTTISTIRDKSGHYSISLTSKIYEDSPSALDVIDHYECRLKLPNTDYMKTKHIAIQPGWHTRPHQQNSSNNYFQVSSILVLLFLPLLAFMVININIINNYDIV